MSKIILIAILLFKTGMSTAQQYFVFIGSDNKQPFYVRVDSEFHSSTAEGHLILAQLRDSTYNITIGFPGQIQPEQHYTLNIHGRDQAFQLQQQGQEGLRLYDLQIKEWLSPEGRSVAGDEFRSTGIKKDDAFSRMMAGVVHDTAVLYNTYAMEQALNDSPAVAQTTPAMAQATPAVAQATPAVPPSTTTVPPPATKDTAAPPTTKDTAAATLTATTTATTTATALPPPATTSPTTTSPTTAAPVTSPNISPDTTTLSTPKDSTTAPLYRPAPKDTTAAAPIPSTVGAPLFRPPSAVTKLSEKRSPRNVRLVYADHSGGKKADTIVVIIPVDTPAAAKTAVKPVTRQPRNADTTHVQSAGGHGPNPDSPAVGASTAYRPTTPIPPPVDNTKPHPADSQRRQPKAVPFINSDCHDFATDFDVDKLRSKMLEATKDDDRINVARKTFKVKCFSTRQVRALSEVFTSDPAKFRFLEAAWPFAADEHFHELSDLLADPVYINKFKTMTHSQ